MPAVDTVSAVHERFARGVDTLFDTLRDSRSSSSSLLAHQLAHIAPSSNHQRWVTVKNIWTVEQKVTLQKLALATAAISVLLSAVTSYWFCRMRKRFRHNLIMLLIIGDLSRTISMLVMASIALSKGQMTSRSGVCQAGGFFLQFGTIMTDWAALALAVHGTVQIMRPSVGSVNSADTMFKYRHWIYAGLVIIPVLCSTLNYIMPSGHYVASGAFCQLPIRPLWYRLALSWIPRYIIGLIILALSVMVYVHVRNVYSGTTKSKWWALSSIAIPRDKVAAHMPADSRDLRSLESDAGVLSSFSDNLFEARSTEMTRTRRFSAISTVISSTQSYADHAGEAQIAYPPDGGRRASIPGNATTDPSLSPLAAPNQQIESIAEQSKEESSPPFADLEAPFGPRTQFAFSPTASAKTTCRSSLKERAKAGGRAPAAAAARVRKMSTPSPLHVQRAIIRRQLRLTFIYPLVYLLMWLAPFVLHCMQYKEYYAHQPPFPLGIIATCCYTLMAAVDCAIFCYRERPWRHIPANRTRGFLSSFFCWSANGEVGCDVTGVSRDTGTGPLYSNNEAPGYRRASNGRQRGASLDSTLSTLSDSPDLQPSAGLARFATTGVSPAAPGGVPNDSLRNERHELHPASAPASRFSWQRLARNIVALPAHGSRSLRGFVAEAHRSDAQRSADERARNRLEREVQDRRERRAKRPNGPEARPSVERNWWDDMRSDSGQGNWEHEKELSATSDSGAGSAKAATGVATDEAAMLDGSPAGAPSAAAVPPQLEVDESASDSRVEPGDTPIRQKSASGT